MTLLEQDGAPSTRRPRLPAKRVGVAVLALLVAALAAGLLIGRVTAPDNAARPKGLASSAISRTLAKRIDALNAGDVRRLASFYAPGAILEERDVEPAILTQGARAIAERLRVFVKEFGYQLTNESVPIAVGPYAVEAASWAGEARILMYRFDAAGRITHQWILA